MFIDLPFWCTWCLKIFAFPPFTDCNHEWIRWSKRSYSLNTDGDGHSEPRSPDSALRPPHRLPASSQLHPVSASVASSLNPQATIRVQTIGTSPGFTQRIKMGLCKYRVSYLRILLAVIVWKFKLGALDSDFAFALRLRTQDNRLET